ncbi:RNA polymerase sigma factor RpoE [Niveibacterium umoris]|uniref:RNA polymerase sigma-70 factor (ECF subfamily) n=1 Tax=Niveibacterium umoris TaxID=1193620 RepID=A0A840BK41_9RHOO|nr:RNA polymerase sigma factor [Niveibacterium umoris]MBB4010917.1 RNA polymerase sigma-70 factor (ECF subfamily) [Niveibacterium umoris]
MEIAERNARDQRWLDDIAAGGKAGERGVAGLFREYRRPLLAFLIRHGVQADLAEDALQDVFVRVVRHAASFRGDSAVSSWIYQIARNLAADITRAPRREEQLDDEGWQRVSDATVCDSDSSDQQALDDCVQGGFAAFGRAHPERAEALRRAALDGWSVRDVAAFLDRTEAATREYLSQCRKRLREFLLPCRELIAEDE